MRSQTVSRDDRHETFRTRAFPTAFETTPLFPFYGEYESLLAGAVSIIFVDIAGQHWQRGAARIAADQFDYLAVNISVDISARGTMGRRRFEQTPGTALLNDTRQPSDHKSTCGQSITLMIPRPTARAHGLTAEALCGHVIPEPNCRVLLAHLQQIREHPDHVNPARSRLVERSVMDLLTYAIRTSGICDGAAKDGAPRSETHAIERFVQRHLESPSLRVSRVARDLKLSRSTLYRHFIERGGLLSYIRNQRLDAAREALIHPQAPLSITDLADRFCFADAGHFSRLFKARFGLPPAAFRQLHGDSGSD